MGARNVCVIFLLTVCLGNALMERWSITHDGDGYSGILVVISDRVPESQGEDIIEKLKVIIVELYHDTFYFM